MMSARKHPVSDFQRFKYPSPKGSKSLKIITPFRVLVNNDFQHLKVFLQKFNNAIAQAT